MRPIAHQDHHSRKGKEEEEKENKSEKLCHHHCVSIIVVVVYFVWLIIKNIYDGVGNGSRGRERGSRVAGEEENKSQIAGGDSKLLFSFVSQETDATTRHELKGRAGRCSVHVVPHPPTLTFLCLLIDKERMRFVGIRFRSQ